MAQIQLPGQIMDAYISRGHLRTQVTPIGSDDLRLRPTVLDLNITTTKGNISLIRENVIKLHSDDNFLPLYAGLCKLGGLLIEQYDQSVSPQLDYSETKYDGSVHFNESRKDFNIAGIPFSVRQSVQGVLVRSNNKKGICQLSDHPCQFNLCDTTDLNIFPEIRVPLITTSGDILGTTLTVSSQLRHINIGMGVLPDNKTLEYCALVLTTRGIEV